MKRRTAVAWTELGALRGVFAWLVLGVLVAAGCGEGDASVSDGDADRAGDTDVEFATDGDGDGDGDGELDAEAAESWDHGRVEETRPRWHFTPRSGWINDPNGLVFFDGEYHLFYQYAAEGFLVGPVEWGHAVSSDLLHWQDLPLAIPYDAELGNAYSGSALVDADNRSGRCPDGPCIVAVFTHSGGNSGGQKQSLAVSRDRGRSWELQADNPVLTDDSLADFRDPKVFWHAPEGRFVMVLTAGRALRFYTSANLSEWVFASEFAQPADFESGKWECPDLFALPHPDGSGNKLWVLQVDVFSGGPQGGSGSQYFVGDFDGTAFTPLADGGPFWLDWGKDFYAAQSFSGLPETDGRRLMIGWLNNWSYALSTPSEPWQGAQSLVRSVALTESADGLRLRQRPVAELEALRGAAFVELDDVETSRAAAELAELSMAAFDLELEVELEAGAALGLILGEADDGIHIEYERDAGELRVDRRQLSGGDFATAYPGLHVAPLALTDGRLRLRILADLGSLELFAQDGICVMSEYVAGDVTRTRLSLEGRGTLRITRLRLYPLASIWP